MGSGWGEGGPVAWTRTRGLSPGARGLGPGPRARGPEPGPGPAPSPTPINNAHAISNTSCASRSEDAQPVLQTPSRRLTKPPDALKTVPRRPKTASRRHRKALNEDAPKRPQEAPRRPQDAAKGPKTPLRGKRNLFILFLQLHWLSLATAASSKHFLPMPF